MITRSMSEKSNIIKKNLKIKYEIKLNSLPNELIFYIFNSLKSEFKL